MKASYYGGIPGNSFYIAKTYSSYTELEQDFNGINDAGNPNCEVQYGQYALIDTDGRQVTTDAQGHIHYTPNPPSTSRVRNTENGQLYMRANDGHPEYIGNITGPSGILPTVSIGKFSDVKMEAAVARPGTAFYGNTKGKIDCQKGSITNDDIEWYVVNLTGAGGTTAEAKIGLKIPYPDFNFTVERVSNNTDPSIEELTNGGKFYHNYKIKIPEGAHGTDITNMEIKNDGKLYYNITEYNNGSASTAEIKKVIDGYPKEITYDKTSGIISSSDANNASRKINASSPIESIEDVELVTEIASPLYHHLLVNWNLAAKNTTSYGSKQWEDLGSIEPSTVLGYYSDFTTRAGYDAASNGNIPLSPSQVAAKLKDEYSTGITATGFQNCGILHGASTTDEKLLYFYDPLMQDPRTLSYGYWRSVSFSSGGGGGDTREYTVKASEKDPSGKRCLVTISNASLIANIPGSIDLNEADYRVSIKTEKFATLLSSELIPDDAIPSKTGSIRLNLEFDFTLPTNKTLLPTIRVCFTKI